MSKKNIKAIEDLVSSPAYTDPVAAYVATMEALNAPPDHKSATTQQWDKLYEVAQNIFVAEPWKYLYNNDRIALLLPGRDEPVYIVVMGNGGMTYGIGIYPGYVALAGINKMEESLGNTSVMFEQHCINLYYGDREELEASDRKVIKELGLKFRGKNCWPYFRSMLPGFVPWTLNYDEAELAITALQNFFMAFRAYGQEAMEVDFENGETLLRFYDPETAMWCNAPVKMPPAPIIQPKLFFSDDELILQLKKKKKSTTQLGLSISHIPAPVQENKNERPRIPIVALLVDTKSGMIINQAMDTDARNVSASAVDMLIEYIIRYGRPASIAVSDELSANCVEDFTAKVGIKLTEGKASQAMELLMKAMGGMDMDFLDDEEWS